MRDASGKLAFVKHQGAEVWSKMDEGLLREIALATGGAYIPAQTRAYDLGQVYEEHLSKLTQGDLRERFPIFLAIGILFLCLGRLIAPYAREESR